MADSSDVDSAIAARLGNDAALLALMPNGVWFDIAAPGSQRFVLVSQILHEDAPNNFGEKAWERFEYLCKAVMLSNSGADVKAAALRIDELLNDAVDLAIPGYSVMRCKRIERFRFAEPEEVTGGRWQHRGGNYEVWVQPLTDPK